MEELDFETKLYHSAFPRKDAYNALNMPVYNNAAFEFETAEAMEEAFAGKTSEHTYSRISNPTVQYFENKVKDITGAVSVTALNSGMAAICNTFVALGYSGANIITSRHLFGNTYSLLNSTLRAFGVEPRFCDLTNMEEIKANIDTNTCAVFLEIITNPQLEVVDLEQLSSLCKQAGIPLVADTTVVPFCAFNARNNGIDIEVVSSTKYISGGATSVGGLVVDYGAFDWKKSVKLKPIAETAGNMAFTFKMKKEVHRNLGAYMTPQNAHLQTIGLETLSLRFNRAAETCFALAGLLESQAGIESVNYSGLPSNPYYHVSTKQFGKYPGAMLTFNLPSKEKCFSFLNKLKFIKRSTNLFDNRSLAIHPASTIYVNFSNEEREKMNISDKTIRLSIGLENLNDLLEDIKQACN